MVKSFPCCILTLLTLSFSLSHVVATEALYHEGDVTFTASVDTLTTSMYGAYEPGASLEVRQFSAPDRRFWDLRRAGDQWMLKTGDGYLIHAGDDFTTWSHLQIPEAGFSRNLLYANGIYLCTGNFQDALQTGERRGYAFSEDLIGWTVPLDNQRTFGDFFVWKDSFYHNKAGQLSRSFDGRTWETVLPKPFMEAWSGRNYHNLRFTPHADFLFAHNMEAVFVSLDGTSWSELYRNRELRGDAGSLQIAIWRDQAIIQRGLAHNPRSPVRRMALRSVGNGVISRTEEDYFINNRFAVWEPGGIVAGRLPDEEPPAPGLYLTSDFVHWESIFIAQGVNDWEIQSIAISSEIIAGLLEGYLIIRRVEESLASDRPVSASPPFPFEPQALPPVISASGDPRIQNVVAGYQKSAEAGDYETMASLAAMLMEADEWTEVNLPRARHYFATLEAEQPELLNPLLYARCLLEFEPLHELHILSLLETAVEQERQGAWRLLGQNVLFGHLGPADPLRALEVLEEGVTRTEIDAIEFLGQVYAMGWGGIPVDFERSSELARHLATLGWAVKARDLHRAIERERNKQE